MIKPYHEKEGTKKDQVEEMFDTIAGSYDFFNHFFSFGIDRTWRKKAIALFSDVRSGVILDVATGTADMAIESCKKNKNVKIIGIDISEKMLDIGREKIEKRGFSERIELVKADSENLPFEDNYFSGTMVAFGVRNFGDLAKGLSEIYRTLKPEGVFVVLEFSKPRGILFKPLYSFYFKKIIPFIAGIFSKDQKAYSYLPASVMNFPEREDFISCLGKAGFRNCACKPLTFGVAVLYFCYK
jgi:demethylmenaquinone methyltransferase / 2-methoxy-6-polyprenyl-1,4-benzoquinol methylase